MILYVQMKKDLKINLDIEYSDSLEDILSLVKFVLFLMKLIYGNNLMQIISK
jgi:hypothetical protein